MKSNPTLQKITLAVLSALAINQSVAQDNAAVKAVTDTATQTTEAVTEAVKPAVKSPLSQVTDSVGTAVDKAVNKVTEDATKAVKQTVEKAVEETTKTVEATVADSQKVATDAVKAVTDQAEKVTQSVTETVTTATKDAVENVVKTAETTEKAVEKTAEEITEKTTEKPAEKTTEPKTETAAEVAAVAKDAGYFVRSASYLVCSAIEPNCNDNTETSAEIIYADKSGKTLVYTDSPANKLGIVDISDLSNPTFKHAIALNGEPTSVTIKDNYALVAVNQSKDYVDVAGQVQVYDLSSLEKVTELDLGGQPDSIAISPDGNFAAVAIENERNEDLRDGALPQLPAGYVVVINTADADPKNWSSQSVELTGLAEIGGEDPEPEYVDINADNIAVVTLQENNHLVLIDLANAKVIKDFSAGSVDLSQIDLTEGKPLHISLTESKKDLKREPDGVSWIDNDHFATANEGDYEGGSRGFSIFDKDGNVVWDSGNQLDHLAVEFGHYPDKRSGNKGNEPENVEVATFNGERLLFVNSERANLVFVYNVDNAKNPVFKQALPAGVGPEGAFALPERSALVVASEVDKRKHKIRSVINVYTSGHEAAVYPTLKSVKKDGLPIAFSALSGLAADKENAHILYAVEDSFYRSNRIFTIDVSSQPALVTAATPIKDTHDLLAGMKTVQTEKLVNADKTVNIDPEGIATATDGGFWVASEGKGSVGDEKKPFTYENLLLRVDVAGNIQQVITLPASANAQQFRFGFEGVAEDNGLVYVAFQRAWNNETNPRIGVYNPADKTWFFVHYPLDAVASQLGGWVGLSDLAPLGNGKFLVLERDNQGGPDAAVKRVYEIDLSDAKPGQTIEKKLVRDLLDFLKKPNGLVFEKVEGLTVTKDGKVYLINDNDGVDGNSGEMQLMHLMTR